MSNDNVTEVVPHDDVVLITILKRSLDDVTTRQLVDDVETAAYQRIGELQPAMTHLFEAVRLEPRMVQARLQLGALLSGQSRHAEGVEQYERAAALRPLDAGGHYGLGLAYEGSGRLTEAQDHYRAAVRLDPGHVARSRLESQGTDFSPSPE